MLPRQSPRGHPPGQLPAHVREALSTRRAASGAARALALPPIVGEEPGPEQAPAELAPPEPDAATATGAVPGAAAGAVSDRETVTDSADSAAPSSTDAAEAAPPAAADSGELAAAAAGGRRGGRGGAMRRSPSRRSAAEPSPSAMPPIAVNALLDAFLAAMHSPAALVTATGDRMLFGGGRHHAVCEWVATQLNGAGMTAGTSP